VRAAIAYSGRSVARPCYHANDVSRDVLDIAPVAMDIDDARGSDTTLDGAGFALLAHRSDVRDFTDRAAVDAVHRQEIVTLQQSRVAAIQRKVGAVGRTGQFAACPLRACRYQ
jgi:hypothetical protein